MTMPTAQQNAVIQELRENGNNIYRVAKKFGLELDAIRPLVSYVDGDIPYPIISEDGLGRIELREFILCTRDVKSWWKEKDQKVIEDARRSYDAGLIEMCQGRDGDTMILYVIKRKVPDEKRHPYFSAKLGD